MNKSFLAKAVMSFFLGAVLDGVLVFCFGHIMYDEVLL